MHPPTDEERGQAMASSHEHHGQGGPERGLRQLRLAATVKDPVCNMDVTPGAAGRSEERRVGKECRL